jgi:hypothetical protein
MAALPGGHFFFGRLLIGRWVGAASQRRGSMRLFACDRDDRCALTYFRRSGAV